jgi:magnesium-transporting ATPase (P-type)
MMTLVVKDDKGKILVFTKGADTGVEPLLLNPDEKDRATMLHLN